MLLDQAQLIFQALLGSKLLSHTEGQDRKTPLLFGQEMVIQKGHNAAFNDQRPTGSSSTDVF